MKWYQHYRLQAKMFWTDIFNSVFMPRPIRLIMEPTCSCPVPIKQRWTMRWNSKSASYDDFYVWLFKQPAQLCRGCDCKRGVSVSSVVYTGDNGLGWDSHADNDATQSNLFEGLFAGLNQLMHQLHVRVDEQGQRLLDNTTVVVCSEMGRTAGLNATNGKDHWPFTSLMVLGAGITGNRVLGGLDQNYQGQKIDLQTGGVQTPDRC